MCGIISRIILEVCMLFWLTVIQIHMEWLALHHRVQDIQANLPKCHLLLDTSALLSTGYATPHVTVDGQIFFFFSKCTTLLLFHRDPLWIFFPSSLGITQQYCWMVETPAKGVYKTVSTLSNLERLICFLLFFLQVYCVTQNQLIG